MDPINLQRNISRDVKYTLALILAGGRGKRLKDLTRWRVKPAVPFGGKYRIIDFALSNCLNSGVRKISVLTQYKSQSLIRHMTNGWGLLHPELGEFIEVLPAQQRIAEKWYSGTADAVYQNIDIFRRYNPEYVLILAGDHIYKMDYGPMIAFHKSMGAKLTIACNPIPLEEAHRFGVMGIDDHYRVTSFTEKPKKPAPMPERPDHALTSMGIYVFDRKFLFKQLIADADDASSKHDFGKDIIPAALSSEQVYAYSFPEMEVHYGSYWRDVGTVDSYWHANMELIGVLPELNLYDREWPIRSAPRQHPPAKFVFKDADRHGHAVDSMVSEGCIVSGGTIADSLLFTNVRVEEYSQVHQSVVLPNVVIGPHCVVRKAIIDKNCILPPGTEIGVDPEADAARFYCSPEGITLVTPEMLGQMIHHVR